MYCKTSLRGIAGHIDVAAIKHHFKQALGVDGTSEHGKLLSPGPNCFRTDGAVALWQGVADAVSKDDTDSRTSTKSRETLPEAP